MSATELEVKLGQLKLENSQYTPETMKLIEDLTKLAFHPDDPVIHSKYDEVLQRLVGRSTQNMLPQVPNNSPQNV